MAETDFDGLPGLDGAVTAVAIIDHDGNPNRVVDDQFPFDVTVKWSVTPPATAALLDGKWTIKVYAESMGPGPEKLIGTATEAANGGPAYSTKITVPVSTLPSDVPPDSGAYKLLVVITYRNTLGVLTEMAAFSEGPMFLLRRP
ncbi:hypothetical protein EV646_102313 [Kribbella antiqua]|uniref:Uncharacterized protein n=1 Tax=Kribbella antiqua TaxID=2512217 RepID=A0A4R2J1P3_9ACTN|nr:hypothetical protein [Kribbella antiqua]TCO50239.1 hypothetical protein EV646_102313 [Kribbella antiqua]